MLTLSRQLTTSESVTERAPVPGSAMLLGIVRSALAMALATMTEVIERDATRHPPDSSTLMADKVLAEASMLLVAAAPLRGIDVRVDDAAAGLARQVTPFARRPALLAGVCLDAGTALEQAAAHVMLASIGYPDPDVDRMLLACLLHGGSRGPERLAHRRLESRWLLRLLNGGAPSGLPLELRDGCGDDLDGSMLGRQMEVLRPSKSDVYALTHGVMYATDLGERRVALPRPAESIEADAVAALAFSIDAADHDLTAEVLMTWPMLGLAWTGAAELGFGVIAAVHERLGFLPGGLFDEVQFDSLLPGERAGYAQATSYHSTFVIGILAAAMLRRPRVSSLTSDSCGVGGWKAAATPWHAAAPVDAVIALARRSGYTPTTIELVAAVDADRRGQLCTLALTSLLQRAATGGDLATLHEALGLALRDDLIDGPAVMQASELMQRCAALGRIAAR